MSRFVTTLRTQPSAVRLVDGATQAAWTVRVQSAEAWDTVRVELMPSTRVQEVKRAAMSVLMPDVDDIGEYVVKLNGFEITDERQSVEAVGALDGSTLLVMSRRRRAVR